jgi:single-strand selective monofunctional uracil DNA glycosylase
VNLREITDRLVRSVRRLRFGPPVACEYNPLEYAREMYDAYLNRYAASGCTAVLLGMNPGPWGMAQTGVPFGAVRFVREWLRLEAPVGKPKREHPKRPVLGLQCHRSEVSGERLWGWARDSFGTPQRFFCRFFVANYCPLAFLEANGRNRTPDKLPAHEREPLLRACDRALRGLVACLSLRFVIGIGKFAEGRARAALEGRDVSVGGILHPSPANPHANRDWAGTVTKQLRDLGIDVP